MTALLLALSGCSEYGLFGDPPIPGVTDPEPDTDPPVVEEECALAATDAEALVGEPTCAPLGGVDWDMRVEWEMTWSRMGGCEENRFGHNLGGALGGEADWTVVGRYPQWVEVTPEGARCGTVGAFQAEEDVSVALFRDSSNTPWVFLDGHEADVAGCSQVGAVMLGTLEWGGTPHSEACSWLQGNPVDVIGLTDLDHDGTPEPYRCGRAWLPDGTPGPALPCNALEGLSAALAADLDGDGVVELLDDMGRWPVDGSAGTAWALPTGDYTFPAVLRDADGELAVVSGGEGRVCRFDPWTGETRWCNRPTGYGSGHAFPVAIAAGDTDGDGVPEVCAAMGATLRVFDLDGNVRWTATRSADGSDSFGQCAMADLDGDGLMEVVDWSALGVQSFQGADGVRLSVFAPEGGPFGDETSGPMILDLDGDGSAEILVDGLAPDDAGVLESVLYALGPATGSWAPTRPVWNQFQYDITSVDDAGHILAWPQPAWDTVNAFRAQPARAGAFADLRPVFVDSCSASCAPGEDVQVSVAVENLGSADAAAGAAVVLLTDLYGGLREEARVTVPDPIPAGTRSASVAFTVRRPQLGTTQFIEVYAPEARNECNPLDNRVQVAVDPCP